jgi:hypothetical protein
MKRTMTPGPIASAASVEGANAPTASPREVDANDSRVRMPQNLANLRAPACASYRVSQRMISWQPGTLILPC